MACHPTSVITGYHPGRTKLGIYTVILGKGGGVLPEFLMMRGNKVQQDLMTVQGWWSDRHKQRDYRLERIPAQPVGVAGATPKLTREWNPHGKVQRVVLKRTLMFGG